MGLNKTLDSSNNHPFLLVAITGGIASGKSTVAKLLSSPNFEIIDADELAREAVSRTSPLLKIISQTIGAHFLNSQGELNRQQVSELIFRDPEARKKLEAIIHPEVQRLLESRLARISPQTKIVIYLVPLLVESKGDLSKFDLIVSVLTDPKIAQERIIARDSCSPELAEKKISSQASNEQRIQIADYLIYNNGTLGELYDNILEFKLYLNSIFDKEKAFYN